MAETYVLQMAVFIGRVWYTSSLERGLFTVMASNPAQDMACCLCFSFQAIYEGRLSWVGIRVSCLLLYIFQPQTNMQKLDRLNFECLEMVCNSGMKTSLFSFEALCSSEGVRFTSTIKLLADILIVLICLNCNLFLMDICTVSVKYWWNHNLSNFVVVLKCLAQKELNFYYKLSRVYNSLISVLCR